MTVEEILAKIQKDRAFRIGLTKESHQWFFMTYLRHHMEFPFAPFQKEMFRLSEDSAVPLVTTVAFRGSGKSTIYSMSFPIWAVLSGRKKFVLIISKTEAQVKQIMYNIKAELEGNPQLVADYGPMNTGDVWNELTLVLPNYTARIVGLSGDSSLRGLRHLSYRPDLIIVDDVEDLDSVRSSDVRKKRYRWFKSELIPAGSESTQIYIVGNLLHKDSLVSRLREEIESGDIKGIYRHYPIVENERPTWSARFRNTAGIEELKLKIGDNRAFQREYMLEIVEDTGKVVMPEWVQHYGKLPDGQPNINLAFVATGIDVAASQKQSADCMALVSAYVYHDYRNSPGEVENGYQASSDFLIYVAPILTNDHLTLQGLINRAKYHKEMIGKSDHRFYLEDAGTQILCKKPMEDEDLRVEAVSTEGMDKRSRLMIAARAMETGRVFFPKTGAEELIQQILGFPSERHDDLADAFSMLVRKASEQATFRLGIWII